MGPSHQLIPHIVASLKASYEPCSALRKRWRQGYRLADFKDDLMAGIIVALVAMPLNMSLAIATGVSPQAGIYTAIIAGFLVALLGGSNAQVSGPTAAFVVILLPIVLKFGVAGLMLAGLMAGIIIFLMGVTRMGQMIQFIPYPVTVGFTAGIAMVIFSIQIKDFFGLTLPHTPESFTERIALYIQHMDGVLPTEFALAALTLSGLILWPRITKKVPAPIVILPLITAVAAIADYSFPHLHIRTIASSFSSIVDGETVRGIPSGLFSFLPPWLQSGVGGAPFELNWATIRALFMPAVAIALLGSIESLLSAVVADGMGRTKHNPNGELVALGLANIITPFFGGIPATGAIARTSTSLKFGAKSPIAAMIHAVVMLVILLSCAPLISLLPMSALAALLMTVAYNMSEWRRFHYIMRIGPKSDITVLLICFFLTVAFDMVIGVTVGLFLAVALFMRRTIELSNVQMLPLEQHSDYIRGLDVPADVMIYKINGPIFFGDADKVMNKIDESSDHASGVILLMDQVPSLDASGIVAFEKTMSKLKAANKKVCLVGLQPFSQKVLVRSNVLNLAHPATNGLFVKETLADAVAEFKSKPEVREPVMVQEG